MREKRSFAERTRISEQDRTRKKYFLVFEGSSTEEIYFESINELRNEIGISPLIELIPIIRTYSEYGWSNPQKILNQLIKDLQETEEGKISYKTLLDRIIEIIKDEDCLPTIFNKINLKNFLKFCEEYLGKSLNEIVENIEKDSKSLLFLFFKEFSISEIQDIEILEKVVKNIEGGQITYSKDIDKMCLIVDRDKNSFKSEQYRYVKKEVLNFMSQILVLNFGCYYILMECI